MNGWKVSGHLGGFCKCVKVCCSYINTVHWLPCFLLFCFWETENDWNNYIHGCWSHNTVTSDCSVYCSIHSLTCSLITLLAILLFHLSISQRTTTKQVPLFTPLHNGTLQALSVFAEGNWRPFVQRFQYSQHSLPLYFERWIKCCTHLVIKRKSVAFKNVIIVGVHRLLAY